MPDCVVAELAIVIPNSRSYSSLESFTSFQGLSRLKSIGGDLEMSFSSFSLESFSGLESLESIGGSLKLGYDSYSSLESFTSFQGLSRLKSIGGDLEMNFRSSSLESFSGLESLESIGGSLKLMSSSLESFTSFRGLNNLKTIDGKRLIIKGCKSLHNINALINVEALDEISITDCERLYDFCVLKNVVQNMSGTFSITNCGYNPTKYQLLNKACSETPENN